MSLSEPQVQDTPQRTKQILSRIFITESGDLVVTDLWSELETLLFRNPENGFELDDPNL